MPSEFYNDGYRDALNEEEGSPPPFAVLAAEYWDGYRQAKVDSDFLGDVPDLDTFPEE